MVSSIFVSLTALLAVVAAQTCPADAPLSCSAESVGYDSCCVNSPGGLFLLTQFWDISEGPRDSFTIHGLWPDYCKTGYPQFCDSSREVADIASVLANSNNPTARDTLNYMNTYWLSNSGSNNGLWSHEWDKHGTCISTLEPKCYGSDYVNKEDVVAYFQTSVDLFVALPVFKWLTADGIVPSSSRTYTLAALQAVAQKNMGRNAVWNCRNGNLNEVWLGLKTTGGFAGGNQQWYTADALGTSSCPQTGIRFPVKTV